ncbi:SRPBCC family protein [Mycobacterium sp. 236(2023)]|uniref:SRPBCC family protein n=1 Tax=Mycobacterium sp. 236(2023) TaxID=3038163 RepID=UPI00241540AF|nr:SRPBCC family protein [Mycobacterium sp. 236(2023)]MDG4669299.1 SRPBCC family protein [Mycobacterium sp. 236(2023)]
MAMQLKNQFEIDADLDQTWNLLTDLERIMPCMPGAALDGIEGDNYLGNVKIKVGPIGAHFRGTARFAQKDDATYSAVITAAGKDPKGQAAANAQIHARLEPVTQTRTRVLIDTDLDISGRMAQFGRGAIADVSNRLIGQFVNNISGLLTQPTGGVGGAAPTATSGAAPAAPAFAPAPAAEASMNPLEFVLPMIKDRYGQALIGGALGFALSWLVFGRRVERKPRYTYIPYPYPQGPQ